MKYNRKVYKPQESEDSMETKTPLMRLFGNEYSRYRGLLLKYLDGQRDSNTLTGAERETLVRYLNVIGKHVEDSMEGVTIKDVARTYGELEADESLRRLVVENPSKRNCIETYVFERTGGMERRGINASYELLKRLTNSDR